MRHGQTPPVFVATIQDITERRQTEARLSYLAYYDVLTNLPNRVLLLERLQQAMVDAERVNRLVAIMFPRPRPLQGHQRQPPGTTSATLLLKAWPSA